MQSGEYDQAIILLFAHQLLLLDGYGALRLNRGKTNRRYIRETRAVNPDAAKCLAVTIEFLKDPTSVATKLLKANSRPCGVPMNNWKLDFSRAKEKQHECDFPAMPDACSGSMYNFRCGMLRTDHRYGRTSGGSAYSSINGYGTFRLAMEIRNRRPRRRTTDRPPEERHRYPGMGSAKLKPPQSGSSQLDRFVAKNWQPPAHIHRT